MPDYVVGNGPRLEASRGPVARELRAPRNTYPHARMCRS